MTVKIINARMSLRSNLERGARDKAVVGAGFNLRPLRLLLLD
jgi:hypothetical protein